MHDRYDTIRDADIDTIQEVRKFNERHDNRGRFASKNGGGGIAGASKAETASVTKEAVAQSTEQVKSRSGVTYGPVRKDSADLEKIKRESGCTDEEAKEAARQAEQVYAKAAAVEPQITKDVVTSVAENNGQMYGLDFRMKQPTSMARKIASDAKEDEVTYQEAASQIKDACRYTAVFDTKDFTSGYNNTKQALESMGYKEVRCKNFFEMYEEGRSPQKAVQCVYENKDGYKFEFQFHTYETQGAKEINHRMYEESRAAGTTPERKATLNALMTTASSHAATPEGALQIKAYSGRR